MKAKAKLLEYLKKPSFNPLELSWAELQKNITYLENSK